jgi:hypothetical protein
MNRFPLPGAAVLALLAGMAGSGPAGAQTVLQRDVIAGGGTNAADGTYSLRGTVGQPGVGTATGDGSAVNGAWGFWAGGIVTVVGVDPGPREPAVPIAFAFGPTVPNPARGAVRWSLALPRASRVSLELYDVRGRRVNEVAERTMEAGRYSLDWDSGQAAPGVYFVRLRVDGALRGERRVVVVH